MQYPHCDSRVLHKQNECRYCDSHPEWQELRQTWGIAFTGHDPIEDQYPCPAEKLRTRESLNRWSGNRAKPTPENFKAKAKLALDRIING